MKKTKQEIIDKMILNKNAFLENLSHDEKEEINIYFDSLIEEFSPMLLIFDEISNKEHVLKNITDSIKKEIQENNLLEKMSKSIHLENKQ